MSEPLSLPVEGLPAAAGEPPPRPAALAVELPPEVLICEQCHLAVMGQQLYGVAVTVPPGTVTHTFFLCPHCLPTRLDLILLKLETQLQRSTHGLRSETEEPG